MSETFNKYFTEIGTNLADQLPNPSKSFNTFLDPVTCSFQLEPVSLSKVLKLLKNLPINKATGLDKIPCRLVNLAAPLIAESLCCIFNTSISSNIFPSDWKIAKIIPIHKGNAKDDLSNYRPISILSPISKMFERLIYDQLYDCLSDHGLLLECRSGFRRYHSTTTLLLNWHYQWMVCQYGSRKIELSGLPWPVNHSILINKLYPYGLCNITVEWFNSYLTGRTQQYFINGHLSSPRVVSCGVPQGSILGHLLFLIYLTICPIV